MKPLLIALGVASMSLGLVSSSKAQQSERIYPIVELTDEDVAMIDIHDGSIEDWLEVVGEPTVTALNFQSYYPEEGLYDPAELDFRIWLAWHDATNRIYVAMERADDIYINNFSREKWSRGTVSILDNDGIINIVVDGDHSGGEYFYIGGGLDAYERRLLANQQAQSYYALAETYDDGPHLQLFMMWNRDLNQDWFLYPPYADGGGDVLGENPTISVTEFYVTPFDRFVWNSPEESVVSELKVGKIIGLQLTVYDWDDLFGRERWTFFRMGKTSGTSSDDFFDALLVGPGGEIPDDSAVESVTWGRIKAQFVK